MESQPVAGSLTRPCIKCRAQEATLDSRSQTVCRDCFAKFISNKCIKQIGILGKEIRTPQGSTRRYLLGLSLGVSSTVLLHLLSENVEFQLARSRAAPFELTVVYVDSSCLFTPRSPDDSDEDKPDPITAETLEQLRQRYPRFTFQRVPLATALGLRTIDWSTIPGLTAAPSPSPSQTTRLLSLFDHLPSAAARADILHILTRHLLVSSAQTAGCHALLLGHSTTALAELTLSETAKGRGFALPWQINDGPLSVASYPASVPPASLLVYHPLRDILRKELAIYTALTSPPLTPASPSHGAGNNGSIEMTPRPGVVVSHKDVSIDDVMFRYFAEIEGNYPSVVANVARTTGKLLRLLGGGEADGEPKQGLCGLCGLCGMPRDEVGDRRWRGELGIGEGEKGGGLCYGCERSTRG